MKNKNNIIQGIGLFSNFLFAAGIFLVIMKLFGYPYLFEGGVAISLSILIGAVKLALDKLQMLQLYLANTLMLMKKALQDIANHNQIVNMNPQDPNSIIHSEIYNFDEMSPEELENLKLRMPFLEAIINPFIKKDITKMSKEQLEKELQTIYP